jgi:hypothetical protein
MVSTLLVFFGCLIKSADSSTKEVSDVVSQKNIGIVIDYTIKNKKALFHSLRDVEDQLVKSIESNFDIWRGAKIEIYKIDSTGETAEIKSFTVPKQKGIQKINISLFKRSLKDGIDSIVDEIKKIKSHTVKSSMYREVINQVFAKRLNNIIIIGDLLIVDHDYNFERKKYGKPDLSLKVKNGINVSLIRIPVPGQNIKDIRIVEAWWAKSLFGSTKSKINNNELIFN